MARVWVPPNGTIHRLVHQYAGAASGLILLGFLWAGLSPFDPTPGNDVSWIEGGPGLRFRRGSVLGPPAPDPDTSGPCSIEVWAAPASNRRSSRIVEFYDAGTRGGFQIGQVGDTALSLAQSDRSGVEVVWVRHAFARGERVLITVASDGTGTNVYLDGVLARTTPRVRASGRDCGSAFVLGTGSTSDVLWNGDLLGLAIYDRALSPREAGAHHEAWRSGGGPVGDSGETADRAPAALYLFDERSGDVVRDRSGGERHLAVPPSFLAPLPRFLERPSWTRIEAYGMDWPDIVVNVGGFAPFGFWVAAFLVSMRRRPREVVALTLSGALLVSLTIEVLQFWLPTRTSSLTDVVTNVLGAASGLALYRLLLEHPADPV